MSKKGFAVWAVLLFLGVNVFGFWGEPVLLEELNDYENGYNAISPCLTPDELSIYFVRVSGYSQKYPNVKVYDIYEATRDNINSPFGLAEPIKELKIEGEGQFLTNPWVTNDNLRLYYSQTIYRNGEYQRFIRMAERESVDSQWHIGKTFFGIHFRGFDSAPCLSEDELRIYWSWNSMDKSEFGVYTAERPNRYENFSNVRRLDEFDIFTGSYRVRVLENELTVYVTNNEGDGQRVIYRGSRENIYEPFGNFEVVELPESVNPSLPFVNSEENRMYMSTHEQAGIYMFEWIERPYDAAVGKIKDAIVMKGEMIDILDAAIETEMSALGDMAEMLIRREMPEGVSFFDVFKARLKVIQSLIKEWKCRYELQKSIYDLEMSLEELRPKEDHILPWGRRSKDSRERSFGSKRRR